MKLDKTCRHGSVVERVLGKNEVPGSIPGVGSRKTQKDWLICQSFRLIPALVRNSDRFFSFLSLNSGTLPRCPQVAADAESLRLKDNEKENSQSRSFKGTPLTFLPL